MTFPMTVAIVDIVVGLLIILIVWYYLSRKKKGV
jgi:uncharacterized protein YneF (UPF0154 family)